MISARLPLALALAVAPQGAAAQQQECSAPDATVESACTVTTVVRAQLPCAPRLLRTLLSSARSSSEASKTLRAQMNLVAEVQTAALLDPAAAIARVNDPNDSLGANTGGFSAFVYDFDDNCVAHAGDPASVGNSLAANLGVITTPNLGKKFQAAAMSGGSWVSYPASADGSWHRAWILAFPAAGANVPLAGPSGLIASTNSVPTDNDLKTTWDSAFPPAWADTSAAVDPVAAYYVGVAYKEQAEACEAGGVGGSFEVCQQENAFNLVQHAADALNAATDDAAFTAEVAKIATDYKIGTSFTLTLGSITTGECVADGSDATNVGSQVNTLTADTGLHEKMTEAAGTKLGRWVMVGPEADSKFAFAKKVTGPCGDQHLCGYYLFASFVDPEHSLLTHSSLDYGYCAANSRTGCSVTSAQNLAFEASEALDAAQADGADSPADLWTRVNTNTTFPKTDYTDVSNWQGYLQKPLGFYVFAYDATDAGIVAQGAIPPAVGGTYSGAPAKRNTYQIQRALNMVTHPRLRELFLGNALHAGGQWLTYQWSNTRVQGTPAPRKRTYTLPWRPEGSSTYEYYLGVGYDDVHPDERLDPCDASEFARCSEEHSL